MVPSRSTDHDVDSAKPQARFGTEHDLADYIVLYKNLSKVAESFDVSIGVTSTSASGSIKCSVPSRLAHQLLSDRLQMGLRGFSASAGNH